MPSKLMRVTAAILGIVTGLSAPAGALGHGVAHVREAHADAHHDEAEHHRADHHGPDTNDHDGSLAWTTSEAGEHSHDRLDAAVTGRAASAVALPVSPVAHTLSTGNIALELQQAPRDDIRLPDPPPRRRPPPRAPPLF